MKKTFLTLSCERVVKETKKIVKLFDWFTNRDGLVWWWWCRGNRGFEVRFELES